MTSLLLPAFLPSTAVPLHPHTPHLKPTARHTRPPHRNLPSLALTQPAKTADPAPASRPHIGIPPPRKQGYLRRDFSQRFKPPPVPVPVETRSSTQWQRTNHLTRSLTIWTFIARLLVASWTHDKDWAYIGPRTPEKLARKQRRLASFARDEILRLGPTMIKAGQMASTRADLLPAEVIQELQMLQDRVPAFSWEVAEELLMAEYGGRELSQVFAWFEKVPLAAASLGQVYRARLWSGEEVVVKVQRPGLKRLFDLDMDALRVVAQYFQRSKRFGGKGRDWIGIYEECRKILYEEIDYEREAASCRRFGNSFREAGVDYVRVPLVYDEYTTERVLCLQYLPGIKISDKETMESAGLDTKLVANRVATAFIQQVLDFAFFSSDPHPGNCAVGADETIIFYDFGMMGELNPNVKQRLVDILVGVLEKDADVVMNTLVDLEILVLPSDPSPVRRAIQYFLDQTGSRPNREQTVAAIGDDLYATAYDRPFRLPASSVFLLRALTTLEGLAKSLDKDFQFSDVAFPFADEILKERTGGVLTPEDMVRKLAASILTGRSDPVTNELRKRVVGAGTDAVKAVGRIEKIEKTLTQLERGDIKLRARSTETEKLLRRQYSLSEVSNYLLSTSTTALAATQLYASGNVEPAAAMAVLSATLGLLFVQKQRKLDSKDRYSN